MMKKKMASESEDISEALETAERLGTFDTAEVELGVNLLNVTFLETLCAKGTDNR